MEHELTNLFSVHLLFHYHGTIHFKTICLKIYKIKHKDKKKKKFNFAYFMNPCISHSEKKIVWECSGIGY